VIGTYAPVSGAVTDWPSLIADCRLMVAFGGLAKRNSQVASGGAGEHRLDDWLQRARAAGLPILVISPNRDDAPDSTEFLPIRPNADVALMLAVAQRLAATGRADRPFLDRYCTGYPRFLDYLMGASDGVAKDAAWAAPITGIAAEAILALADRLPGSRCFLTAAWSLQRAEHGEQPYWMLITLASMLGGIGQPGGGFGFGHG
jgi:biotin/methionine sulfoxide reductase